MKSYQQFLPIPENLRPAIKAGPKASSTIVPFWLLLLLLLQSYPTLSDPTDSSPPGSPVHGIFQARVLKWSAIAFSVYIHAAKSLQSCLTLCDPIDSSPPGSPVHGIFQARVLEWIAIAFSKVVSNSLQSVDCSMSGSSVLYYLPKSVQIHVH